MTGDIKKRGKTGVKPVEKKGKTGVKVGGNVPKRKPTVKTSAASKPKSVSRRATPNCKPKPSQSRKRMSETDKAMLREVLTRFSLFVGMCIIVFGCMFALKLMNTLN